MKDKIKEYEKNGFSVIDVKTRVDSFSTHNVSSFNMKTPYYFEGRRVQGFCNVDEKTKDVSFIEFYGNLDGKSNVNLLESGLNISLTDRYGKPVSIEKASEDMSTFAKDISEYPHVFTKDEYLDVKYEDFRKLGLPEPTDSDYKTYLDFVEKQMLSNDIKFVGKITNINELAHHSMEYDVEDEMMYDDLDFSY